MANQLRAFSGAYPSLVRWVNEHGRIELGYQPMTDSFIRVVDDGGMIWKGKPVYKSVDHALKDAERGTLRWLKGNGLDSP